MVRLLTLLSLFAVALTGCGGGSTPPKTSIEAKGTSANDTDSGSAATGNDANPAAVQSPAGTIPAGANPGGAGATAQKPAPTVVIKPQPGKYRGHWLIGTWTGRMQIDEQKVVKALLAQAPDKQPTQQQMKAMIGTLKSLQMEIRFDDDGRMALAAALASGPSDHQGAAKGMWELVMENEKQCEVRSIEQDREPEIVTINKQTRDSFYMQPPKEYQGIGLMVFQRAPANRQPAATRVQPVGVPGPGTVPNPVQPRAVQPVPVQPQPVQPQPVQPVQPRPVQPQPVQPGQPGQVGPVGAPQTQPAVPPVRNPGIGQ